MYAKKTLDGYFFKTKGFYVFFIPIGVPYKKIYKMAEAAGFKLKEQAGPILESGRLFGFGWIGVEIAPVTEKSAHVTHLQGEFNMYEHRGPYKELGTAYKKVMKECPSTKQYLNLYLDDPEKVKPSECRTQILFK